MNNTKGFTLIELLVVVLIIGILAAMAMPQYFKAVERSRMSEAVTLLANIAQAQQRKYLQINRYATAYTGLDVAPKGASGASYYTKGDTGNGFHITLGTETGYTAGSATATRVANGSTSTGLQYQYILRRYYASNLTSCQGSDQNGRALCADFCGIDSLASGAECCSNGASTGGCPTPVTND